MTTSRHCRTFVAHLEDLGDGRYILEVHHGDGTSTRMCVRADVAREQLADDARAFIDGRYE